MNREDIINNYGRKDGKDKERFDLAIHYAGLTNRNVEIVFKSLVELERDGYISLKNKKYRTEVKAKTC